MELARYLTELAKSGLPLDGGLRAIAKDLPPGRLSRALDGLAAQLEAGQPLPSAIESFGKRLPPHLRELMIAGARSGNLAQTLDQVLAAGKPDRRPGPTIASGRRLPDRLTDVLGRLDTLRLAGRCSPDRNAALGMGHASNRPWREACSSSRTSFPASYWRRSSCGLMIVAAGRAKQTAAAVSRLWSRLPWIGPAWWYRGLVEFSGLMGVFLQQGKSLPDALRLTSLAARDPAIRGACRRMADEAAGGQALSTCLARRSLFPPTLVSTVTWGESHAALAEACQSAQEMFSQRVKSQTELIGLVLPPIVFLLLVATVIFFVAGLLSGLLNLIVALT